MKKRNYAGVAATVYVNYAIVGMATIIISQYSSYFQEAWNTDVKGVSTVLSVVGVGRLLTILFAGVISDRIGRRKTMIIAMVTDIIFLLGAAFSHSLVMACIAALFFGATNTFGDTSGYPAITEAFPKKAATMNSLVKAAMSLAQFVFPFWVATVHDARLTVFALVLVLVLDIVWVIFTPFAPQASPKKEETTEQTTTSVDGPKMALDGVMLIFLGFSISFTFYVFSQYAPYFGSNVLHLAEEASKTLISWYAMASMISVFITATIVTKIKPLTIVGFYSLVSALALAAMVLAPSLTTARIASVAIGFFGAGGIWQLGLAVLTNYFPHGHGKLTSYYSLMASTTYFIGPLISSFILNETAQSVLTVFWIDTIITIASVVVSAVLIYRKKKYNFD